MGSDVEELLARYVSLHNERITGRGEPGPDDVLADGVEVAVEGDSLSLLRRQAIIRAFHDHELVLWRIGSVGEDVAFANYAWRDHPRIGGIIRVQSRRGRISRLTLRPGYSRIFGLITKPVDASPFSERGGEDAFAGSGPTG